MYETFYGFSAKPFQLRPDPHFFFGSKGHKRAMAYLEYGLSQGEGFIVITGEVGAGKTTLVRNLFNRLPSDQIVAAHIVNTHLDPDDTLRMVVSAFRLPYEGASKTDLLTRLEKFLCDVDHQGKRALLVIDEAQNLSARTVEELRMLSNFQTDDKSLLQTFLLGQPEFRATLHSPGMQQLRQRVIASYHLGPMDAQETRAYVEHRLGTVGWKGDPSFDDGAYAAIFAYSGGIPRKVNTLMDRVLLMGYLEEMHAFGEQDINTVVKDISEEFEAPDPLNEPAPDALLGAGLDLDGGYKSDLHHADLHHDLHPVGLRTIDQRSGERRASSVEVLDERMMRLEKSIVSVLSILKKIVATPQGAVTHPMDNQE
jgi:putative secretion ATPase (PEP-CTERM system associated)